MFVFPDETYLAMNYEVLKKNPSSAYSKSINMPEDDTCIYKW